MSKRRQFHAVLQEGDKGAAVIVPFDPVVEWGTRPVEHGVLPWKVGHLVRGTLNGVAFEGWIGARWGRPFILIDEELQAALAVKPGDTLAVVVEPR